MSVSAECIENDQYLIIEKYQNEILGIFKDGDTVICEKRDGELYAIRKIDS